MKPKAFLAVALVAAIVTGAATAARAAGLPDGYTAVEYIESTGGQYIDTGVAAKTGVKVEARALWTTEDQDSAFIGARKNSEDTRFYPIWYYDGALSYGHKEWKPLSEAKVPANSVVDIVSDFTTAGQATIKVGSSEYQITGLGDAFDTGLTMYLGALNNGGSAGSCMQGRIYSCKIYEMQSGTLVLVRDFVPCVRESDLAVGLYDLAASDPSKAFYSNAGSGKFGVPEGTFCTVTVGPLSGMTAAYTFGDGSVTNAVSGESFRVLKGQADVKVIFTANEGYVLDGSAVVDVVNTDQSEVNIAGSVPTAERLPAFVTVTSAKQRWPWNGKVDVGYALSNTDKGKYYRLITAVTVDGTTKQVTNELGRVLDGNYKKTVDCAALFGVGVQETATVNLAVQTYAKPAIAKLTCGPFLIINLTPDENGKFRTTECDCSPTGAWTEKDGWTDAYKRDYIVLRKVEAGRYPVCGEKSSQTTIGYWIGVFEVTQAQYDRVMGASEPSNSLVAKGEISYETIRGTSEPSVSVTGESFMKRLCDKCIDKDGKNVAGFDLPTAWQWSIAYCAGTTTQYYWGDSSDVADQYAWFLDSDWSKGSGNKEAQAVGLKKPNAWGLYDLAGNVFEWCRDVYNLDGNTFYGLATAETYNTQVEEGNPVLRWVRGGAFDNFEVFCGADFRVGVPYDFGYGGYGFRLSRICDDSDAQNK